MIKVLINQHIKDGDIIMMKGEQKLVPKKEITDLKKEVRDLKKALIQGKFKTKEPVSSKGLKKSMDNLSEAINELVNLFTVAKDIGQQEAFEGPKPQANSEMQSLVEQNKAIAKGILAITQMLKEYLPQLVNLSRGSPKYKILRVKQSNKPDSTLFKSRPQLRATTKNFPSSELPSMPELDDSEFPKRGNDFEQD